MAKTTEKVVVAAGTAKPYVERAIRDEELHDNLRAAFAAGREIYNELAGGRGRSLTGAAQKVSSDAKVQGNLRTALEELREASSRLQGTVAEERRRRRHHRLLLLGVVLAILFNPVTGPTVRGWLQKTVSGGTDDEFGYPAAGNDPAAGNGTS